MCVPREFLFPPPLMNIEMLCSVSRCLYPRAFELERIFRFIDYARSVKQQNGALLVFFSLQLRQNKPREGKNYCDAGSECKLEQLISELVTLDKSFLRCETSRNSSISAQPDVSLRFMLVRMKEEKESDRMCH